MITKETLIAEHISKLEKRIDDALAKSVTLPVKIPFDDIGTNDPNKVIETVRRLYISAGYSVHFDCTSKKDKTFLVLI